MKRLHRSELYTWSAFQEPLDIDFNGFAIVRAEGNVLVDPLPLSAHDEAQLRALGGVAWIVITNSYHVRASVEIAAAFGARLAGPRAEREGFPVACARWLGRGDELVPGLVTEELDGSKTPGELALVWQDTTLISGDLVRAHAAGSLMLLAAAKLKDPAAARASIGDLVTRHPRIGAVLVGDGWSYFGDGAAELRRLARSSL